MTTPSQTIGPYLHIGLSWLATDDLTIAGAFGDRITVEGRIVDADAKPVTDAVVEIWQADAEGRYAPPADGETSAREPRFTGFGRVFTDAEGRFRFHTIAPGRVPAPDGSLQAPHLSVAIFMRGLLKQLMTRIYFPGDPANEADPVLMSVPAARRDTLIARSAAGTPGMLEWNVVLQGRGETVFFDA